MNPFGQFRALMRKNYILMKRSCCATTCEILFPMLLMILLVLVRRAVSIDEYTYDVTKEELYYKNYSSAFVSNPSNSTEWNSLQIRKPL